MIGMHEAAREAGITGGCWDDDTFASSTNDVGPPKYNLREGVGC